MPHTQRLRLDWYQRRAEVNHKFKEFFINKIYQHCPDIGMCPAKLYALGYEDLCELAIASVNKNLTIIHGTGQDFNDTSDAKTAVSQSRNNNKKIGSWYHSIAISGVKKKVGPLRVVAYNHILDDFHFFYIPRDKFRGKTKVEITIERVVGRFHAPTFTGTWQQGYHIKWRDCEKTTFEEICLRDPTEDTAVWDRHFETA